jgi:hypothetical protein
MEHTENKLGTSRTQQTNMALQSAEQDATATVLEGQETWRSGESKESMSGENVKEKAKQVVNETLGEAKGQVKSAFADQKARAAERLGGVAGALRQTSQELRSNQNEFIADYTEAAAQQVDRFSSYLTERDLGDLMGDLRGLAQRQPEVFVAGALAAGFLLGRFIKSSGSQSQYGGRNQWQNNQWQSEQWRGGDPASNRWSDSSTYGSTATGAYNPEHMYDSGSTGGSGSTSSTYGSTGTGSSYTGASGLSGGYGSGYGNSGQSGGTGTQEIPVSRQEES